jgi:pyridoxine 5-phosphate synthase
MAAKLSVNINKVATLRNARGGNLPNLIQFAIDCEQYGAQGITVHPRPDERHIRYVDVIDLKKVITTELNVEGFPNKKFMELIKEVKPHQCTLVPDSPLVLTSNNGWDTTLHFDFLKNTIEQLKNYGCRVSIFINPLEADVLNVKKMMADRIEIYTGEYAHSFEKRPHHLESVSTYTNTAKLAHKIGLGVNAGHDLNLQNLSFFVQNVVPIDEVSIGHSIIADSLYFGIQNVIAMYLQKLKC